MLAIIDTKPCSAGKRKDIVQSSLHYSGMGSLVMPPTTLQSNDTLTFFSPLHSLDPFHFQHTQMLLPEYVLHFWPTIFTLLPIIPQNISIVMSMEVDLTPKRQGLCIKHVL